MKKTIKPTELKKIIEEIKKNNKSIVVIGGCFDILHIGHLRFIENAKKQGDYLFILLENDPTVKRIKGRGRPINPQKDRAEILEGLSAVDFIVLLDSMSNNKNYDDLIDILKPDTIATTKNDPTVNHKIRQTKRINAKLKYVIGRVSDKSSTKLAEIIYRNFK